MVERFSLSWWWWWWQRTEKSELMWGSPARLLFWWTIWCMIFTTHLKFAFSENGGDGENGGGGDGDLVVDVDSNVPMFPASGPTELMETCVPGDLLINRPHSVSITEFGAVGDGKTLNTKAFENAIFYLRTFAEKGGAQLYIPAGQWVTGSFNLTSHLTLYLDKDAVILGSQDIGKWPIVDPLPSYGRGRELPGPRHMSLIHGENLTDVVITGDNGTVDGQGFVWWEVFKNGSLDYTRPHLVELINSTDIFFSNVTFRNSPFWTLHPVYCSNVVFKQLTILAPHNSPNTDGIDPDSSTNVCIEDCFISVGDDAISIKSGWDEYGIAYGRPSTNIFIRHVFAISPTSAGIAIGSEMSGGVANVNVHHMTILDSRTGFRLKTAIGRGGYVANISVSNIMMRNVTTAIAFTGQYGEHPDDKYDPEAYPIVDQIVIKNVQGELINEAGTLFGIRESPFRNICLAEIALDVSGAVTWACSDVEGYYKEVSPLPCSELLKDSGQVATTCSNFYQPGGCLQNLE
ncbi:unnamed protein product [Calypogeia fissa]